MTVFSQFAIGRTAMRAFRLGMNLSGYNVANANTPGFSRRRLELGPLPTIAVPGGWAGMGVDVVSVHRVRDPFLDFATRREMGRLGADTARAEILAAMEPMFGEVGTNELQGALTNFFDSLESLSVQPDDPAVRENVLAAGREVAATFHRLDTYLVESRRSANQQVADKVDRVNDILDRLSQINVELLGLEAGGGEASDLRDERDRLVDELSGLLSIRTVEADNGQVSVYLEETGDTLLAGELAHPLETFQDAEGMHHVTVRRGGEQVDLTERLRGGALGGYLEVRDEDVPGYRERLDTLAAELAREVNAVHSSGYGLDGSTGLAFFVPDPPSDHMASAIQVNARIEEDPRRIAAADAPDEPGNNAIALQLAALREEPVGGLGGHSFAGYGADLMAAIGRDTASADASRQAGETIVDSLDLKRQQVAGVSLDEEAADLAKWQQSYQAAARYMQTVNRVTEMALGLLAG